MHTQQVDVLLVGAGIMSTTLAMLLSKLDPTLSIMMLERLPHVAHESTDGWNNAGTGHAGYCELNYTPQQADGHVQIQRALGINANFETSLQFWSYLVKTNALKQPSSFINATPHLSFVWGDDVAFLRKRFAKLSAHHLFDDMEYSEDRDQLHAWMPLIMQNRPQKSSVLDNRVAATRVAYGSDVDFGSLTRQMVEHLEHQPLFQLAVNHSVKSLKKQKNNRWLVTAQDRATKQTMHIDAGFVFLGAGGAALSLLQKSGIEESKQYGGFPVSGRWLVCHNEAIIQQHHAKVYGKAPVGSPPMSVPHLDTRIIGGKPTLLFGPYAGFTTKFLKQGSFMDLLKSMKRTNMRPILSAGRHNLDLTKYLIGEVFQSHSSRLDSLRQFYPEAKHTDWKLAKAGQRVQIIKHCDQKGGKLEFGTEIVASHDGSLAALLGASPGASTSVAAMLEVLERCFSQRIHQNAWQDQLREMIPAYGDSLITNERLSRDVRDEVLRTLALR